MFPWEAPKLFLLNLVSGAGAAFSVRKLSPSYQGPCCNIRRSSDNAQKDIGFAGIGIDEEAFSLFVGGGSGFVTKWYDQSGNGRDASQSTAASQPQLTLNTIGTRPALVFSGSQWLATASFAAYTSPQTMALVVERTGTFTSQTTFMGAAGKNSMWGAAATNRSTLAASGVGTGIVMADSAAHAFTGIFNGSSSIGVVDGTPTTVSDGGDATGTAAIGIGGTATGGALSTSAISEAMSFLSMAFSSTQYGVVHSNQSAYYGTS